MTISPAASSNVSIGPGPIDTLLEAAREHIQTRFEAEVPFGAEDELLDQATRAWQIMGQAQLSMAVRLAQFEANGTLLQRGGQRSLAAWCTHAFGMGSKEAGDLARLARAVHHQQLPETATEVGNGTLSVGEAGAIARAVERQTHRRHTDRYPDADVYGRMIETGLVAHKRQEPQASAAQLDRLARDVGARLNPAKDDADEKQAHAERGAALHQTINGAFVFRAWGGAADAEVFKAALEAFSTEQQYVGDHQERTYDAWARINRYALGHQSCEAGPGTLARVNITVPWATLVGLEGADPATTDTGQVLALTEVRSLLPESVMRRLVTEPGTGRVIRADQGRRVVSAATRAAAFHGHTTCAWAQGCNVPVRFAQADHKIEFHRGGSSAVDNIQPLCATHNRLKHRLQVTKERRFWKGRARMSRRPEDPAPYPDPYSVPGTAPGSDGVLRQ